MSSDELSQRTLRLGPQTLWGIAFGLGVGGLLTEHVALAAAAVPSLAMALTLLYYDGKECGSRV